ncbi:MAG: hypothetical protein K0S41_3887, partial [Anaerocolumna sp.]|jgi:hypothetical protein|nr:hypothetical protein [Anaerocolumna sp.]
MEDNINNDLLNKINYIIHFIGKQLEISTDILRKLFYMEMVMADCWNIQDGNIVNPDNVKFAERILLNT